jgi:preprotein translocase subunit SecE
MDNVGGVEQPKRMVAIAYVIAALALGVFLEKVIELVLAYTRVNDFAVLGDWSLSAVLGFGLAAAAAAVVWRIPRTQTVSLEVALELQRVTWPSVRETRAATVAVIVASAVASVILGVFDMVWSWLSAKIY